MYAVAAANYTGPFCVLCRAVPGAIEPRGAGKLVCRRCALDLPIELLNDWVAMQNTYMHQAEVTS